MGRKHCGKMRNCSLRAISPFPTVFSKGLFAWGVKRCHWWEWVNVAVLENVPPRFTEVKDQMAHFVQYDLDLGLPQKQQLFVKRLQSGNQSWYHGKYVSMSFYFINFCP